MQIKPLYIPLQNVTGKIVLHQTISYKARVYLKRYGQLPKGRNYNKTLANDPELKGSIAELEKQVGKRVTNLLRKAPELLYVLTENPNPHWTTTAAEFKKLRCKLMCEISNLCRAKAQRSYSDMEVCFYHINTAWLALNRLVHGEDTQYKNAKSIAYEGNFIPMKERWYGKRRTAK